MTKNKKKPVTPRADEYATKPSTEVLRKIVPFSNPTVQKAVVEYPEIEKNFSRAYRYQVAIARRKFTLGLNGKNGE